VPWFSYHGGHSGEFSRHAAGCLEDVVRSAVEAGFSIYGLSEHAPRYRVEDLFPDEADLRVEDLARMFESYVVRALELRERYADRIELLVGFESEVLPEPGWAEQMRELRRRHPEFDYLVGSVHHVGGIGIDMTPELTAKVAEDVGGRDALERLYFELVGEMVERLRPEIVGHFDLIRKFDGFGASFGPGTWKCIESALEVIRAVGSVLDVNAAPARRGMGPVYPLPPVLELACEMGIPVTLGDDSHGPAEVGVGLDACLEAIRGAGYRRVHYLTGERGEVRLESAPLDAVRPQSRGWRSGIQDQ
jgi:histidinol-phosphatase (PHP family)